jgi:hypothetical protein
MDGGQVQFMQCPFNELPAYFEGRQFDLVYSNFGGLNCIGEKEVLQLSRNLSRLMAPGGQLFLVVMSRFCLWEILYYTAKGKLGAAFRRRKKSIPFEVGAVSMPVVYYSPGQLKKLFRPHFIYQQSKPVGLFIPPGYLESHFLNRRHWLNRLDRWERTWGKYQSLSPLADHFCITFKPDNRK